MGITSLTRVDVQLAGVWTDITDHVFTDEKITIRRGLSGENTAAQPSSAVVVLNNTDGRFTPRNTSGTYYPNFTRNTPIRIGVGVPPVGAALGNQTTTSISAPAVNAEQAGLAIAFYAQNKGATPIWTLPAGYTGDTGELGGTFAKCRTAHKVIASSGPVAAAVLSSTNGALAAALQVFIPGSSMAIGATATMLTANASSGYNGVEVGPFTASAGDLFLVFGMWSQDTTDGMSCGPQDDSQSSDWFLIADSGVTVATAPRVVCWAKYATVANASLRIKFPSQVNGANDNGAIMFQITGAVPWNGRFVGQCSDISTTSSDGYDVRATVTCGGPLRQLGIGNPASKSVLARVGTQAFAYWPMEVGTLAGTTALSPTPGVAGAQIFGGYTPGNSSAFPQSQQLGSFAFGNAKGLITDTRTGANVAGGVYGAVQVVSAPANTSGGLLMAQFKAAATGTAVSSLYLQYASATVVNLVAIDGTGATITGAALSSLSVPTMVAPFAPVWAMHWAPNATNPTTQVDVQYGYFDVASGLFGFTNVQTYTMTIGALTQMWIGRNPTGTPNFDALVGGHMMAVTAAVNQGIFFTSPVVPTLLAYRSLLGYVGELNHDRMLRIAQEQSIALEQLRQAKNDGGFAGGLYEMGVQAPDTPLGLLNLCAVTDTGLLAETRGGCLMYRSVAALSGQPSVATLAYGTSISPPLVPTDDDQMTRNDVTVTQQNGAVQNTTVTAGALGTLTVGDYATAVTVNVREQQRDLPDIANWLAHVGTVNQQRFPLIALQLEATSNVPAFSSIDIGQRVTVTNTPVWIQPGPFEQIVIGMTEQLGPVSEWSINLVCAPYTPYGVIRLDGGTGFGELDSHYLGLNGAL